MPFLLALIEKNGRDSVVTQRQAVRILEVHATLETVLTKAVAGDLGQVGRRLAMRGDALRERCRELQFRAASSHGYLKDRYSETYFIEDVESAASALKEYGFWSLIRLLPLPERELVRAEENPTRPDYRAARTPAELDELQKMVKAAETCALDTEASDKDPRRWRT